MQSSNKALIVGTGFGKLYKSIYESIDWEVTTVDIADPEADYTTIPHGKIWDTCHITTPNYTHYDLADLCANFSKIVFVEKPGVNSTGLWSQLLADHPNTRIMMTKNNQYRDNIPEMARAANPKKGITRINWINNDRVPNPGSWFTNKELAFGGVSRDLMPHLLSLYQMFDPDWRTTVPKWTKKEQRWQLKDLTGTDYGAVDYSGTYDVDDFCYIDFGDFQLNANWRNMGEDSFVVLGEFLKDDIAVHTQNQSFQLGLCPENAYREMIKTALFEKTNDNFWQQQMEMDLWIHQVLDNL